MKKTFIKTAYFYEFCDIESIDYSKGEVRGLKIKDWNVPIKLEFKENAAFVSDLSKRMSFGNREIYRCNEQEMQFSKNDIVYCSEELKSALHSLHISLHLHVIVKTQKDKMFYFGIKDRLKFLGNDTCDRYWKMGEEREFNFALDTRPLTGYFMKPDILAFGAATYMKAPKYTGLESDLKIGELWKN